MTFCEFVEILREEVGKLCGDGARVMIQEVTGNNGTVHTVINMAKEGEKVSPVIHLEAYYQRYEEGDMSIEEAVREIYDIFMTDRFPACVETALEDFERIKDKLIYCLVDYGRNQEELKDMPCIRYCDLAVIFCLMVGNDENGYATAKVHHEHMKMWNVDVDTLYELAKSNTPRLFPAEIKSMDQVIKSIMEWESQEKGIEGDLFDVSMSEPMYILTNQDGFKGAAAVLYEGVLKEFAKQEGCDLLILPSSIHEMILVPYKKSMDVAELGEMVRNINRTTLPAEEILSDSVYLYSRETDQVTMAYGEAGRQE